MVVVLASTLLGVFVLSGISLVALRYGLLDFAFNHLYRYQLAKLKSRSSVDVVFLGDSSLGNSIDAQYFASRTGFSTANLALTGAYGYGGTYNMLRRTLAVWRPKVVVIMQTPDMLTRGNIHEGFIHTVQNARELVTVPLRDLVAGIANLDNVVSMLRRLVRSTGLTTEALDNDYIRQGPPLDLRRSFSNFRPDGINRSQKQYVELISRTCNDAGVQCLYAHGPLLEQPCIQSDDYFREANAIINGAGLTIIVGTPLCIPVDSIGDAVDHVSPAHKRQFTDLYLSALSKSVSFDRHTSPKIPNVSQ